MSESPSTLRRWLAGREAAVLFPLLLIVLGVWGFIAIADKVREGGSQSFDERVVRGLRQPDDPARLIGPAWMEKAARDITALGGHAILTLVVLSVAGYLLLERKLHAMWLVLIASGGGWEMTMLLKRFFGRERPSIVPQLVKETTMSFPSGHAMMSAVVYLTLGALLTGFVSRRRTRAYLLGLAILVTLLVGSSRVLLGVHYPTDVLAGWSAGLTWALVCWLVARFLQKRGAVEGPAEVVGGGEGGKAGR